MTRTKCGMRGRLSASWAIPLVIVLASGPAVVQCGTAGTEAVGQRGDPPVAPENDRTTPAVTVISTEGLVAKIKAARGKVLVVNFWATWCPQCINEMPELVKFYRSINTPEVAFMSVSADHPDTLEDRVKPFVSEHELPFPVYVTDARSPEGLVKALNLDWEGGLPATFVFDKNGTLRQMWTEEIELADLTKGVAPLRAAHSTPKPVAGQH